jgi:hypothetical protein
VIGRFWRCSSDADCRWAELVGLGTEDFQVREEHWVIADLIGKGKESTSVRFRFQCGWNAQSMSGPRRLASTVGRSSGE